MSMGPLLWDVEGREELDFCQERAGTLPLLHFLSSPLCVTLLPLPFSSPPPLFSSTAAAPPTLHHHLPSTLPPPPSAILGPILKGFVATVKCGTWDHVTFPVSVLLFLSAFVLAQQTIGLFHFFSTTLSMDLLSEGFLCLLQTRGASVPYLLLICYFSGFAS